jgi:hypothetical protein
VPVDAFLAADWVELGRRYLVIPYFSHERWFRSTCCACYSGEQGSVTKMAIRREQSGRKSGGTRVQAPARFPASVTARQKTRPLHEVLSVDVALEKWSQEEREEFEQRFTRRFRRSFWGKNREKSGHWQFYCPLCGCSRRLPHSPSPWTFLNLARVGVTTALVTLALWPWLDWMGVIAFVPLWAGFELVFRVKVRAQLVCDQCGFDPMLYMTDVARARREVEEFWKQKLQSSAVESAGRSTLSGNWGEERGGGESGRNSFKDPPQQGESLLDRG